MCCKSKNTKSNCHMINNCHMISVSLSHSMCEGSVPELKDVSHTIILKSYMKKYENL